MRSWLRPRLLALLALPALFGLGGFLALASARSRYPERRARTSAGQRANKLAADRDAQALLAKLVLPAGAQRTPEAPPGVGDRLAESGSGIASPDVVDRSAFWIVPASVSEVLAFMEAHPPLASQLRGSGSAIKGGVTTSRSLVFEWRPIPLVLYIRTLTVQLVALANGSTALRADALDMWDIPRPLAERVPSAASVLDVTVTRPRTRPSVALTVNDRAKVEKIAKSIDVLPTAQPVAIACPNIPVDAPAVIFTFRATRHGPALAQASESASASGPDDPCEPMSFTLAGRNLTPLLGGAKVVEQAQTLLGVTLRRAR